MPLKRHSSACFCNFDCPWPSVPYIKYWAQTDHPTWPEYHTPILYEFVTTFPPEGCVWQPITPVIPSPSTEDFDKRQQLGTPFDHAYFCRLKILDSAFVRFEEWQAIFGWNDDDLPIDPGVAPSCDQTFVLPSIHEVGWNMTLTPAPLQACP